MQHPVPDRQPYQIEAVLGDPGEVVVGDERLVVSVEPGHDRGRRHEGVLVDRAGAGEQRRCHPGLEHEPAAEVDSPHLLHRPSIAASTFAVRFAVVTTPVDDAPTPEQLVLGPSRPRQLPRWLWIGALTLGLLLVVGAVGWRVWPRPPDPLTLDDLQDAYAGMVRADGTNDASVLTRSSAGETELAVTPGSCTALVEMTMANHFPAAAVDGVGTYWLGQSTTISLFTLRFPDATAVQAERERLAAALGDCAGQQVQARRPGESPIGARAVRVTPTPLGSSDSDQLGYLLTGRDGISAIQLLPYENTLTWQYRYEPGATSYSTLAADQLMSALRSQLDAVVAARPR